MQVVVIGAGLFGLAGARELKLCGRDVSVLDPGPVPHLDAASNDRSRDKGMTYTGIDVIGDCMTEINITSAADTRESESASDFRIAERMLDTIESEDIMRQAGGG